jgi:protein-tyrosine phosphatase
MSPKIDQFVKSVMNSDLMQERKAFCITTNQSIKLIQVVIGHTQFIYLFNPSDKQFFEKMQCGNPSCTRNDASNVCSACHVMLYCSNVCAKVDWKRHKSHHHEPPSHVLPFVYLGGLDALKHLDDFIDGVVTIIQESKTLCKSLLLEGHRPHLFLSLYDDPSEDISQYFDVSADFIHSLVKQNKTVLVHCAAGVSRSTSLVVSYMMKYLGYKTVESALEVIRKNRPFVNPNKGFIRQLKERYEGSSRLVRMGRTTESKVSEACGFRESF